MNFLKRRRKPTITRPPSRQSNMSTKTKNFIQKICYKKTASVDMTKHGFINDNKLYAVNLLLRPLREKLEKICGKLTEDMLLQGTGKSSQRIRKYDKTGTKIKPRTRNLKDERSKLKNKKFKEKKKV